MLNTFLYLGLCAFLIWFIQSQKIFDYIFRGKFLKEIRSCGICLGFWICLALFPPFQLIQYDNIYQYIIFWVTLSATSSVLVFLAKEGYRSHFGITIVK